jgi:hypothetical protein
MATGRRLPGFDSRAARADGKINSHFTGGATWSVDGGTRESGPLAVRYTVVSAALDMRPVGGYHIVFTSKIKTGNVIRLPHRTRYAG